MHEAGERRREIRAGTRSAPTGNPRPSSGSTRLQLVITGDDLGMRADWDAGIFDAVQHGVLTSTSVATNGPTYGAAAQALRVGGIDCGVHLNLIHGEPLSPAAGVSSCATRAV